MDETDYIKQIQETRKYSAEQLDKQIVYIAGGGLVLTIGFAKEIVELPESNFKLFLFLSWILFAFALFINLFSHQTSIDSMDAEIALNTTKSDKLNKHTDRMNRLSIWMILIAMLSFIIFAIINLLS